MLAALSRKPRFRRGVQGRTNRQTPEWASTHPLSENRMQRALAEARATGQLGTGIRNRDGFLAQFEGIYVDDDPAQGIIDGADLHPPGPSHPVHGPAGLSDVEWHRRGDDLRFRRARPSSAAAGSPDRSTIRFCSRFEQLTRGQTQLPGPAAAARDDQRHAGRDDDGSGQQRFRADRRQRRRLSMGCRSASITS